MAWVAPVVGAGIQTLGAVLAANEAAGGNVDAARIGSAAAAYEADVQARSAAAALAFQQQQAAQNQANQAAVQQANYYQWRAREARLSTLGQMLGQQPWQIPNYMPLPTVGSQPVGNFSNTSPLANVGINSPYAATVTPTNPLVPGTGNPNFGGQLTLDQLRAIQAAGGMDPNSPNARALAGAGG